MIRFSAILVAGAIAVLAAGVLATSLALVYLSIGVSILASVLLAVGVILRRREIFGEAGAAAATGQPAWPVTPATGTPAMVGGRARIPGPRPRPGEAEGRPAEAGAGSRNGNSGPPAGRDVPAEIRWARQEQERSAETGPARAPRRRNGPGRNGPGPDGPANAGPARAGRTGDYSGTHNPGRGRPPTAPPGRRRPAAPTGPGPRAAGEPATNGSASGGAAGSGQDTRSGQRAAGTAPPGRSEGPPGPSGRPLAGSGPPAWPDPDNTWQEPTGARRPSREPEAGWVFTSLTPPPDLPASPAEKPDVPAAAAEGPDAGITQQEPAHDRRPPRETEDRAATPPTPERPLSPAEPDHPALPSDDFWNRVNDELAADAERELDSPPRAASAGPPPPAAGGDLWSRSADWRADEVTGAGDAAPGRAAASQHWNAWAPSVSGRPGSPSAGDEDEPRDHADERAAGPGSEAGTLGPLFAWRDAAADHASETGAGKETADAGKDSAARVGKETADAGKEADVEAEEAEEEEEAAPSPWSIPLTLVGDLSDLDEEGDGQPAGPGAAGDHRTGEPPAAGEKPAPERTDSDVWTRLSWPATEEKQAGPTEAGGGSGPEKPDEADRADAGRGPWLTRPGKGTAADWAGRDPDDAALTGGEADADDHAKAATRAGGEAGADDHAKTTPTGRDADADGGPAASRAGRDDEAVRSGRDDANDRAGRDGADDEAKATQAARVDGDAAPRATAETDADAAEGTPAASAGSAPGPDSTPEEAGPRTPGEANPPAATSAGKATPVGRPSATLFEAAIGATRGSTHDPDTGKTAGPGTQREAPSADGGTAGQRAPEAGSGTGAGQTSPAAAAAGDGDKRGAAEPSGAERSDDERSGPAPPPDGNAVVIVPGVARYHRTGCILIRFLGGDGLETSTAQAAEAKGCAPCRACAPDKPLSSGD